MLNNIFNKIKCDVKDCKNDATCSFDVKLRGGKCFLCDSCLAALTSDGRQRTVPKSPQSAIKKRLEHRAEEANSDR